VGYNLVLNKTIKKIIFQLKLPKFGTFRILKTPKRLLDFQTPENAKKMPFQALETAKNNQLKAPENSKKVLAYLSPLKTPKRCYLRQP
jgi:hypothetical protein